MNPSPTLDDLKLSTAILNFLAGGFQGIISYQTVLKKLNHPLFSEEELTSAEKMIGKIAESLLETYNGNPTFLSSWSEVDSFEAASLMDALERLRSSLIILAKQLEELFELNQSNPPIDQIESLFAALARRLLGTDAYLQEQYRTAYAIGDTQQIERENLLLNLLSLELEELTNLGDRAFEKTLSPDDISLLRKRTKDLSRIFAAQAHECRVLAKTYDTPPTFTAFEIPENEAYKWSAQSIDPIAAGYFIAYGLDIEDLVAWGDAGFYDPAEIFSWKSSGFLPHAAASWKAAGFVGEDATPWMKADYQPEAARAEVDKGVKTPKRPPSFTTKIPASKVSSPGIPSHKIAGLDLSEHSKTSPAKTTGNEAAKVGTKDTGQKAAKSTEPKIGHIESRGGLDNPSQPNSSAKVANPSSISPTSPKPPFKTRNTFTIKRNKS